jgi:Concanavalin A-like lectin/glucanases superfamily
MIIQGVSLTGTRVVDASIITSNLAIWLDADNSTSYPGTGTSVFDLSGNGYTHTLSSSGIYTTLSGVKCFDCSSTGEVSAAVTGPILPTTGFTYICWGRLLNSTSGWRTLWRTTPDDHPLLIELGSNRLGMYDNNGGLFQYSGYTATGLANIWVQYAVTGTNTAQTFYINGQQVGTTAYGTGGNRHNEWGSTGGGQPFGYVANMFLYTSILTREQIQQNYYGLKGRFGV